MFINRVISKDLHPVSTAKVLEQGPRPTLLQDSYIMAVTEFILNFTMILIYIQCLPKGLEHKAALFSFSSSFPPVFGFEIKR